jgi:hypothetical protein
MSAHENRRLVPIERWHETGNLWPENEYTWRYLLRNREHNGLKAAVVKIGSRILIDEQAFLAWALEHREAATEEAR